MAAHELCNLNQTRSKLWLKTLKWNIAGKITFCLPCEGFQVNFESDEMTSLKRGVAADSFTMAAPEVTSFETNFVRIAGTSEA